MEKILQACIVFIFHGQNHLVLLYNVLLQYQAHRHQGDLLDIKFFYKKNIKQGCQGEFLDTKNVSLTIARFLALVTTMVTKVDHGN